MNFKFYAFAPLFLMISLNSELNAQGRVGLGTMAPAGKLHIKGSGNVSQLIIDANSTQSNTNPLLKLRSSSGTDLMWIHSDDATNVFVGVGSGGANDGGNGNTFIGSSAGYSNSNGSHNTVLGYAALFGNVNGGSNTAVGYGALNANSSGSSNTAIGSESLFLNTNGTGNTALGFGALNANTQGDNNTATGLGALNYNSTGDENTATGSSAMYSNTTGYANTATGWEALNGNLSGHSNTANGYRALRSNTSGDSNTAIGIGALQDNTSGNYNTAIGTNAFALNTNGVNNTAIGGFANVSSGNLLNATAIGAYALVTASHKVRIGDSQVTVIEGQVGFSPPSDGRFKENIREDVQGLEFIMKLHPVSYNFNRLKFAQHIKEHLTPDREKSLAEKSQNRSVGFIAQDVERIIQQTGFTSFDAVHAPTNETDNYSMGYAEFVVPLVKAVQELNAQSQTQQALIETLLQSKEIIENQNALIEALVTRINALEKR